MLLRIDLIADFVCPWCHVGEARLREAFVRLAAERPEVQVELVRLPFFLDENVPPEGLAYRSHLERKFGGAEALAAMQAQVAEAGRASGVGFDFEAIERRPSTMPAHRLIQRVQGEGADAVAVSRLAQAIFSAYFEQGADIGAPAVLASVAARSGFDDADLAGWLAGEEGADEVAALFDQVKALGVTGVPFFVFDQRLAVSGAHPPENLLEAMRQALDEPERRPG